MIAGLTLREFVRRRVIWVLLGPRRRERRARRLGRRAARSRSARESDVAEIELRIGVSPGPDPHRVHVQLRARDVGGVPRGAGDRVGRRDRHRPRDARPAAAPQRPRARPLARAVDRRRRLRRDLSGLLAIAVVELRQRARAAVAAGRRRASSRSRRSPCSRSRSRSAPGCRASPRAPITVVLFGLGWFAGVLGSIAVAFDARAARRGRRRLRVLIPTDGLWRGVIYGLEPPLVLLLAAGRDAGGPARPTRSSRSEPPPPAFIAWSVVWVVLVLLGGDRAVPPARALSVARRLADRLGVEQVGAERRRRRPAVRRCRRTRTRRRRRSSSPRCRTASPGTAGPTRRGAVRSSLVEVADVRPRVLARTSPTAGPA